MIRLVFAQMARSKARLVAAGLAITISTAFIATALLATKSIDTIAHDTLAARYAQASLVVTTSGTPIDQAALQTIRSEPGVTAAEASPDLWQRLDAGDESTYVLAATASETPQLIPYELASGAWPTSASTIALTQSTADRLKVNIGSTLTAPVNADASDSGDSQVPATLTVCGIIDAPAGLFRSAEPALVSAAGAQALNPDAASSAGQALVLLDPHVNANDAAQMLSGALGGDYTVETVAQAVEGLINDFMGSTLLFIALIYGFGAIALLVAALVISNTFQVLVAQRTHQLALLRCVGATRSQVRRSVLIEAVLLSVIASVVGVALGITLAQSALWAASGAELSVPVPRWVSLDVWVFVVPLACGMITTVLAALLPARVATRVAPLAALRPEPLGASGPRGSRTRLIVAAVLAGTGAAGLALIVVESIHTANVAIAFLAMAGGIVAGTMVVVAVVLSAIRWLPPTVAWVTSRVMRHSAVGQLTAANLRRNPRRTAATATALVIGVGLVAMMSTGAASADATLGRALDERNPVDIVVGSASQYQGTVADSSPAQPADSASDGTLSAATVAAVSQVGGVEKVARISGTQAAVTGAGTSISTVITAADPRAVQAVQRLDELSGTMRNGWIELPGPLAAELGVTDGQELTVTAGQERRSFQVHVLSNLADGVITTPRITTADMATLDPHAPTVEVWLRIDDARAASDVAGDIMTAMSSSPDASSAPVTSAASYRQGYQRVISTMLTIVLALLGASVVIALIGVANTLSLSVIERRRESAILRAVGLKRSGLRAMLAIEGLAIALAGTLAGLVLGLIMGWAGTTIMLAGTESVRLVTPWGTLAIAVVIAVLAGLLSSVLPAKRAASTPPVAALAEE